MKYVLILLSSIFSLAGLVHADNNFAALLESKGVDANAIYNASTVSRDTVAELLNYVDCKDCHRPSVDMVNSLTQSWWTTFRQFPGKNFDDVNYNESLDKSNNYYCIAYVGNEGYMNGYPRSTSPLCSGRFCGSLPITNADLIQTVFNITSKTFYSDYNIYWSDIAIRLPQQAQYIQKYFSLQDLGTINTSKAICNNPGGCKATSPEALATYAKYCTFEPEKCGMKELSFAKKGQWPIAEMNMLVQKGVFTEQAIQNLNIDNYAAGDYVLDVLGRVKPLVQCQDTDDQDADGVKDYEDNCYRTYNPSQRDTDGDRIGNVCDDDIDGDAVKNPIGAVDDEDHIQYPAFVNFTGKSDNCLFTQNTDQRDEDKNSVGNTCDITDPVGLRADSKQLVPSRYALVALYSGNFQQFIWYYGDKTTSSGEITTHTYAHPGEYLVRVEGTTVKGQVLNAYLTLTVGDNRIGAILTPSKLIQSVGEKVGYTIQLQGLLAKDVDYVDIQRGDGRTRQLRGKETTSFTDSYSQQGVYSIYGNVHTLDGRILAVSATVTVKGGDFCMPYNTNIWAGHCDMNKDGIPDMCDTDIDGDGVANQLGLIRFEKPDCTYDVTNTNPLSTGLLYTGSQRDNCPFFANPTQKDCKLLNGPDKDIDGDDIPDTKDLCPTVPETVNGIADDDGCPEYNVNVSFPGTTLQAGSCQACPCQYAQNDATLAPGDRVKAVLYDSGTGKPVTQSSWYTVP